MTFLFFGIYGNFYLGTLGTNRFKELDLIECLKSYGWRFMTLYRRQESRPFPRKRNVKGKMAL